mmetsp:Transcript_4011/g.17784  ORF Transcript_4011/g.17784 Transcript_4011/m.17784 type:complete len:210 (-) Transcript_4011:394-1023(-)
MKTRPVIPRSPSQNMSFSFMWFMSKKSAFWFLGSGSRSCHWRIFLGLLTYGGRPAPSSTRTPSMSTLAYPMKSFNPPKSLSYTTISTLSSSSSSTLPGGVRKWKTSFHSGFSVFGIVLEVASRPLYLTTTNGSDVLPASIASKFSARCTLTKRHLETTSSHSIRGSLGVGGIFAPALRRITFLSFSFALSYDVRALSLTMLTIPSTPLP